MSNQMRTWKVWIRTTSGSQILVTFMAENHMIRALDTARALYGPALLSETVIPA
jgi:hypothetical protein